LKALNELSKNSILVLVPFDILLGRELGGGPAKEVVHRFEPARAFTVRNGVESTGSVSSVVDWLADRVSARH
jgi:hypothetical protein